MDTVVDAFAWPLRLLGLAPPKEGELDHLPLLALPPNCIVNHLVPALDVKEKENLSLTCSTILQLMAGSVQQLKFDGRQMCYAAKSPRLLQLSNVRMIKLTLHGWHDIGFAAPRLLLHLSLGLPHVEDVVLLDQSAADDYEFLGTPTGVAAAAASFASSLWNGSGDPVHCEGCGYENERTDLSCVLISCLALFPKLKRLEIYTKLLSDAELSAVGRFPELTSLTLNSEDGVMPGALCSLSSLTRLRELRLGDVDGNNPDDVETVCNLVSQLTSLHMGYCPRLQPPVLRRCHQLHAAVQAYRAEQAARNADCARRAAAGTITKAAQAAASFVGSVASSVLPGVVVSTVTGSSSQQQQPRSLELLKAAGVPIETEETEGDGDSGNVGNSTTAALTALSYNLPSSSRTRDNAPAPPPPNYDDPATHASVQAAKHPGALQCSVQQQHSQAPAGPAVSSSNADEVSGASDSADSGTLSGGGGGHVMLGVGGGGPGIKAGSSSVMSSANSDLANLQVVTELSVNIDAEEGDQILKEMSQLALLESLTVDSTDEFKFDPGFQPFNNTTNLVKLGITMPMSLANTQSLSKCRKLRELLLCTLPQQILEKGSFEQVTRLELLDVSENRPNDALLQAFPTVTHLIIRAGADDTTLNMIGHNMTTLRHLELYNLAVGYSRSGLKGIAHLESLRSLILEVAAPFQAIGTGSSGHSSGWGPGAVLSAAGLVGEVAGDLSAIAGNMGVPLLGTNAITAFEPPPQLNLGVIHLLTHATAKNWFPKLQELRLLGYVAASDMDLPSLTALTSLQVLHLHLQRSSRGLAGKVTLRGLWNLAEQSKQLQEIRLTGAMETTLMVPGRAPGVGL